MTSQYQVNYSPEALDDLRSIYSYIAFELKEKDTAKRQTDRIREKIRGLDLFPEKYKAVDWEPWASMNMRQVPIDNFVAFYTVNHDDHTVLIIRIFYGGRDIPKQF